MSLTSDSVDFVVAEVSCNACHVCTQTIPQNMQLLKWVAYNLYRKKEKTGGVKQ